MKSKIFYILILLLLFSIGGFAQDKPSWITAIEKTIGEKETEWKIEAKIERADAVSFHETLVLKSAGNIVSIEITEFGKITNPEETFDGLVTVFDNTMGKTMTKTKLENFGDQGFIWTDPKKDGWAKIKFRKKDIFVNVFASSEKITRRFAQYVLDQMQ